MQSFFSPAPQTIMGRFASVIQGVLSLILWRQPSGVLPGWMERALNARLVRAGSVIATLMAAMRAGTLRPARAKPVAAVPAEKGERRVVALLPLRLPGGFAWLVKLLGSEAASYGSQLLHMLGDSEMSRLLALSPRAMRIVKQLCRMLGVVMPGTPEPTPRAPRQRSARKRTKRAAKVGVKRPRRIASRHFIPTGPGPGLSGAVVVVGAVVSKLGRRGHLVSACPFRYDIKTI